MATKITMEAFERRLDNLRDGVKHAVQVGADTASNVRGATLQQVDKLTQLIKQHPLAAIGIAFGSGYLLMRIVRR